MPSMEISSFRMRGVVVNRPRQRRDNQHAVENVQPNGKVPGVWNACRFFPFAQVIADGRD